MTFNYDTLLDQALGDVLGFRPNVMDDYFAAPSTALLKLHGSVNWVQQIATTSEVVLPGSAPDSIKRIIIAIADKFPAAPVYRIVDNLDQNYFDSSAFAPAIAIPVQSKGDFACPVEHVGFLRGQLHLVDRILVIGWRASEQHMLKMLADGIVRGPKVMVVGRSPEGADATIANLRAAGLRANYSSVGGGFSDFRRAGLLSPFLGA